MTCPHGRRSSPSTCSQCLGIEPSVRACSITSPADSAPAWPIDLEAPEARVIDEATTIGASINEHARRGAAISAAKRKAQSENAKRRWLQWRAEQEGK